MNKHALEITDEIIEKIMADKTCKIAHIAVEPDGDPNVSVRTLVRIQFSVYDREENLK